MKVESSDIDKLELCRLLEMQYGLQVLAVTFNPEGEESYGYTVETAQSRYFVKVCEHNPELDVRYEATHKLHTECGLEFVVRPLVTQQGEFQARLDNYSVAVFDFVDGTVSDRRGFSDQAWKQAATLTASLHKSKQCPGLPSLPLERFELWFEDWLLSVLGAAEETIPLNWECEREARKLLAYEKQDILPTLQKLKRLAGRIPIMNLNQVVTHGDLKPENFIKDSQNNLHLIDWSKIALAPPERDLINFVGERFELFLAAYMSSFDQTPRLSPGMFEFYNYFSILWGIADYGSWVLLEDVDPVEKEYAWQQLQRHLPIDHEQVNEVEQVIAQVVSASDDL